MPSLVQFIAVGWLIIMLLLPFHGFISTWGGTTIGPLWLWKAWKEILLAVMAICALVQLLYDRSLLARLWGSWLSRVAVAYGLLHVIVVLVVGNQAEPVLAGLAINLRIPIFLIVTIVLCQYLKLSRRELAMVILVPMAGVILFGLLQLFVLPYDFLTQFGYDKNRTIAPYNTIDQQLDQLRIMSTTRGPNPLGAYLILPLTIAYMGAISLWQNYRNSKARHQFIGLLSLSALFLVGLMVLYGSHSRSAWIGFALSVGLYTLIIVPSKVRLSLMLAGAALLILGGIMTYQYRDTRFIQNVIIHDNPDIGPEVTSNSERRSAYFKAFEDIRQRSLFGCAPGCAGPASFYDPDGARLAENYYLQVAQEVGVLGLILFISLTILTGFRLYHAREDRLVLVLFTSLIGISVANLLLHVWADDTLAYVWWGLLGAVLASTFYKHKRT